MRWRERVYRALLRCYPAEFRDEYAREMLQAFDDGLRQQYLSAMRCVHDPSRAIDMTPDKIVVGDRGDT